MANYGNYQPTSAPYSADNLDPHDKDLVRAYEFGTDVTLTTGDAFVASFTPGTNSINARFGALEVENTAQDPDADAISGTTFLMPPFADFPAAPIFPPGATSYLLMAHLMLPEQPIEGDETFAYLVLAAEDFVGQVAGEDFTGIGINPAGNGLTAQQGEEAQAVVTAFGNGAGSPWSEQEAMERWGTSLYIRLLMAGDDQKESEAALSLSRDGLTWTQVGPFQVTASGPCRRVGLGIVGNGTAWLDWLRVYNYPIEAATERGLYLPTPPITGGRRF